MVGCFPSTFSVVAFDPATREWGVAVQSRFLAAAAVVSWARAEAGAVATQAWANMSYGPQGLELLAAGLPAEEVVERLVSADEGRDHRQLGVVDRDGRAAAFTGAACLEWAGHVVGEHYACQGNILAGQAVVTAMAEALETSRGPLPERLVAALEAGQAAGGDRRGQQSAGLLVVREKGSYGGWTDRAIDLRVDDHPAPIVALGDLLRLHRLYFGTGDPARLTPVDGSLAAELQALLARAGHYRGRVTGEYDAATREALERFFRSENFEERWKDGPVIDGEVLEFMRRRYAGPGGGQA